MKPLSLFICKALKRVLLGFVFFFGFFWILDPWVVVGIDDTFSFIFSGTYVFEFSDDNDGTHKKKP